MKKIIAVAVLVATALIGCEQTQSAGKIDSTKVDSTKVDTLKAKLVKADSLKDTAKTDTAKKIKK